MPAVKSDEPPISGLPISGDTTGSARQAAENHARGLAALHNSQPDVAAALSTLPSDVEWLYARDGSLSAKTPATGWLGQCSLPLRAAGELLADMTAPGRVSLLLHPTHAAQISTVLNRLAPQQAVIALHETLFDATCALACHDFSPDIRAGRLNLLAGPEWPRQLEQLLSSHAGLPAPEQYLRTSLLPAEAGQRLMEVAGRIIDEHSKRSVAMIDQLRTSLRPQANGPVLFLAGSAYRPWNLGTPALSQLLYDHSASSRSFGPPADNERCQKGHSERTREESGLEVPSQKFRGYAQHDDSATSLSEQIPHSRLDIDRPDCSAAPGLLASLRGHRAILSVELTRRHLPQAVPPEFPLVTWLLYGQIPPASSAGPHDRLIVASRELANRARQGGWPAERLLLAVPPPPVFSSPGSHLGIIADYVDLDPSKHSFQLSSHRLLFEAIGEELLKNPLALGSSVTDYLTARAAQLNLRPDNLDLPLFVERLILPVYARGIARLLASQGLPLRLIGARWESDDQLRASHAGNPHNHKELYAAISQCATLVDVWPVDHPPPLHLLGRPVLKTAGRAESQLLHAARSLAGPASSPPGNRPATPDTPPVLTADMLALFLDTAPA